MLFCFSVYIGGCCLLARIVNSVGTYGSFVYYILRVLFFGLSFAGAGGLLWFSDMCCLIAVVFALFSLCGLV